MFQLVVPDILTIILCKCW